MTEPSGSLTRPEKGSPMTHATPPIDAVSGTLLTDEILDAFLSRIDRSENPDGCWIWKGPVNTSGRPRFHSRALTCPAAHIMWSITRHSDPHMMKISSSCGNPRCIAPHHLKPYANIPAPDPTILESTRAAIRAATELGFSDALSEIPALQPTELPSGVEVMPADPDGFETVFGEGFPGPAPSGIDPGVGSLTIIQRLATAYQDSRLTAEALLELVKKDPTLVYHPSDASHSTKS